MQDRIPLYPGRVTLTPVSGQANTYDMVRADQPTQEGTPLNKANLLTDATAAQYGLEGVVPNDIFSWLGKYNEHWWRLLHGEEYYGYAEKKALITESVKIGTTSITYSPDITISDSGSVSLVNQQTFSVGSSVADMKKFVSGIAGLAPIYVSYNGTIYYIPAGATSIYSSSEMAFTVYGYTDATNWWYAELSSTAPESIRASVVTAEFIYTSAGNPTYEHSANRNAYPDNGTVDGITYCYLGIPYESAVVASKIETGAYVGTGTRGNGNPNSLTFEGQPKCVIISDYAYTLILIRNQGSTRTLGLSSTGDYAANYPTWSGNTVSWYCAASESNGGVANQMNYLNRLYRYVAFC